MHPSLRNSLIERLAEAMRVIGLGGTFERFGQIFMDHYLGIPLSHRGLNVLGNPVGGTIDTKDDMARYAAEYSGEMTYFAGDMAKPINDLDHVLKLHPGVEQFSCCRRKRHLLARSRPSRKEKRKTRRSMERFCISMTHAGLPSRSSITC